MFIEICRAGYTSQIEGGRLQRNHRIALGKYPILKICPPVHSKLLVRQLDQSAFARQTINKKLLTPHGDNPNVKMGKMGSWGHERAEINKK
jgi:hypothetical protein